MTDKTLVSALAAAQAEMTRAIKDAKNPHFKSSYADLASVCDACMPALTKSGIAVVQPIGRDEHGPYVDTMLMYGSETLSCRIHLIMNKNDMQGLGSAITYARRYGLMAMTGVAPDDDDGNAAVASGPVETKKPAPKISADEIDRAKSIIAAAPDMQSLKEAFLNMPKETQSAVTAAKDARKAEIEQANALDGDDVPDFLKGE